MFPVIGMIIKELSRTRPSLSSSSTEKLHALIITTSLSRDPFYATHLVRLYGLRRKIRDARKVFDESPERTVFLWNAVIRVYARARDLPGACSLFAKMSSTEIDPDGRTFACLVRSCSENLDLRGLKLVHGRAIFSGLGTDSILGSAIVTAYSKLGFSGEAFEAFKAIREPDLVLWNSVISAVANKSSSLFNEMRRRGNKPDGYTIVSLLLGAANSSAGKSVHGFCLKTRFDSEPHVASALVSMYSKSGSTECSSKVFRGIFDPDLVTWTSLVTGLARAGKFKKAFLYIAEFVNLSGKKPDSVLIASILSLASRTADAKLGAETHAFALRHGFDSDVKVGSSLLDMYSKSGLLESSKRIFETMSKKNIVSYNALISGFGLHGLAGKAFETFAEALSHKISPDHGTFSALLCACSHSDHLVRKGVYFFEKMSEFSLEPGPDHHVYLVKLLGKKNDGIRLGEAYRFVLSLPKPVDHGVWGALLSCCEARRDFDLAEIVAERLVESYDSCCYRVMISNSYACDGRFEDAKRVREGGFLRNNKTPGISWIQ